MYTVHCLCVSLIADKYFPFICDVVIKLLLAQDNYQSSLTTASNLLSLSDKWKSRCKICSMCMLCTLYKHVCMHSVPERLVCVCVCVFFRRWCSLYQSLLALLHHWAGDTATSQDMEVHVYHILCVQ